MKSMRNKRVLHTLIDVAVEILGIVLLTVFLTSVQTTMSIRRQAGNSKTNLEIAQRRMTLNVNEALVDRDSYDQFSIAKLETVLYFINSHPDYADIAGLAAEWELAALYRLDANGEVDYATDGTKPDFKDESFGPFLTNGKPTTVDSLRFYMTSVDGVRWIAARNDAKEMAALEKLCSPGYALGSITVGTKGYIMASDADTGAILYHPQSARIGQNVTEIGLTPAQIASGSEGWVTLLGERYYAITRSVFGYQFTAVVPANELTLYDQRIVFMVIAVFAGVVTLLVAYALILRRDEQLNPRSEPEYYQLGQSLFFNRTIAGKIKNVAVIGLVAIFALSLYTQSLAALSRQSAISRTKTDAIDAILAENDRRIKELSAEYDAEYAGRARRISLMLQLDPTMVNDETLAVLSEHAQVSDIYVFNKYGRTIATNSVYKGFTLSRDSADQSYPFWDVVNGYKDELVQEARQDDSANHNYLQYVGVKRLDDAGMVQLALVPRRLSDRLHSTELDYVLRSIAVENDGYLLAVSKADGTFVSYPKSKYIGRPAADYGLKESALRDEYQGYQTIDGTQCFVTSLEKEDAFICAAVPTSAIYASRMTVALIVTAGSLVVILLLCAFLLFSRRMMTPCTTAKAPSVRQRVQSRFLRVTTPSGKPHVTADANRLTPDVVRWKERTPEQKLLRILYILVAIIALTLVAMLFAARSGLITLDSIISYIIGTQWEKTPNIFSLTYIVLICMEILVLATILRKGILYATQRFGARSETIGRLLDSFVKYVAALGALFYSLNFLGIDSATLLTSAGIFALVIGLGAQKLIGDILAGIFVVFEGEFRVGDIVTIGDWRGTVLEIGIRTTKIQDTNDDIKIFNNSEISGIINMTKQYSYASVDIGIEYSESLERVESVLNRELPHVRERLRTIVAGPYYKGVSAMEESRLTIRITAQCKENDRVQLNRDLNRELRLIFDRNAIKVPYPQIVLNRPAAHELATNEQKREAATFVKEQKELSRGMSEQDNDV